MRPYAFPQSAPLSVARKEGYALGMRQSIVNASNDNPFYDDSTRCHLAAHRMWTLIVSAIPPANDAMVTTRSPSVSYGQSTYHCDLAVFLIAILYLASSRLASPITRSIELESITSDVAMAFNSIYSLRLLFLFPFLNTWRMTSLR